MAVAAVNAVGAPMLAAAVETGAATAGRVAVLAGCTGGGGTALLRPTGGVALAGEGGWLLETAIRFWPQHIIEISLESLNHIDNCRLPA